MEHENTDPFVEPPTEVEHENTDPFGRKMTHKEISALLNKFTSTEKQLSVLIILKVLKREIKAVHLLKIWTKLHSLLVSN